MKKDILEVVNPIIHTLQDVELLDGSAVILLARNKKSNSGHVSGSFNDIASLLAEITFRNKDFGTAMRVAIEFIDQQDDDDNTESGDSDNDLESEATF